MKDLAVFSPSNCFKHSTKLKTVKDVLRLPSKSLGDFMRSYGREWVIGYLSMWLLELNDNSNVKNKMNDAQIEFTSERIYDMYSLKVTDLTLFFRNVKEGKYGGYYENLSQEKIMQWLSEYWDNRCEYGQMMSQGNNQNFSATKDKMDSSVIKEMFKDVGQEHINHSKRGNGSGSRMKKMVVRNRVEFLNNMLLQFKALDTNKLKEYVVGLDVESELFDQEVYDTALRELDLRT